MINYIEKYVIDVLINIFVSSKSIHGGSRKVWHGSCKYFEYSSLEFMAGSVMFYVTLKTRRGSLMSKAGTGRARLTDTTLISTNLPFTCVHWKYAFVGRDLFLKNTSGCVHQYLESRHSYSATGESVGKNKCISHANLSCMHCLFIALYILKFTKVHKTWRSIFWAVKTMLKSMIIPIFKTINSIILHYEISMMPFPRIEE